MSDAQRATIRGKFYAGAYYDNILVVGHDGGDGDRTRPAGTQFLRTYYEPNLAYIRGAQGINHIYRCAGTFIAHGHGYSNCSLSGATNVSFRDAVLSLRVTPQITPNDHIILDLAVNKDSVGEIFAGVPSINTREVSTQVLVGNGETVVLGGVYEQTRSNEAEKVPFLGDLPIAGALFRQTRKVNDKSELLIFVTPKIIKEMGW